MPTANLTWTNKSTALNPETTKVERSEGFPFGHANASAPVELDNSASGGLDPTQANGSYTDTTVEGGKRYAYRISTVKGGESAAGIPSPVQYVQDRVNDLAYPNGDPDTASQYNVSVEPVLHLDMERSSTGYVDSGQGAATVPQTKMDSGYAGIIRHDSQGAWQFPATVGASLPAFWTEDLGNGQVRDFMVQPANGIASPYVINNQDIAMPDGVTVFAVGRNMRTIETGNNIGGNIAVNGVNYLTSLFTDTFANFWGLSNEMFVLSHAGPTVGSHNHYVGDLHIQCFRFNNSASAFGTGELKAQMIDGGDVVYESANLVGKSYHNNNASPDISNNLGAAHFRSGSVLNLGLSSNYTERMLSEKLIFDSALDANDMNMVFGYLGNKFNIAPTVLAPADLVN
ncbi:MAG: hypothetical protein CL532_00870 [Aestuariivita sp.]|nr:hypothetical protein [Aestuariivita sp.]